MTSSSTLSSQEKKPQQLNAWVRFTHWVQDGTEGYFYKHGAFVARHPLRVALLALLLAFACIPGVFLLESESEGEKLWAPQNTRSFKERDRFRETFSSSLTRGAVVMLANQDTEGNVVTRDNLLKWLDIHEELGDVTYDGEFDFERLCERQAGACVVTSVLDYFAFNRTLIETTPDIWDVINTPGATGVRGNLLNIESVLGGRTTDANGRVTAAKVTLNAYSTSAPEDIEDTVIEWELDLIDALENIADRVADEDNLELTYQADISLDTELEKSVAGDVTLFSITFSIMITFTFLVFSDFRDMVRNQAMVAMAGAAAQGDSKGGMVTKLAAAKVCLANGCRMVIADGRGNHPLKRIEDGANVTWFLPSGTPKSARKRWIAGALNPTGAVVLDAGAVRALGSGKSLLPAGVVDIEGDFQRGDAVVVKSTDGRELGRGLSAYSAADARRIMGYKTSEIEALLGYRGRDEMIHRDDLVLG